MSTRIVEHESTLGGSIDIECHVYVQCTYTDPECGMTAEQRDSRWGPRSKWTERVGLSGPGATLRGWDTARRRADMGDREGLGLSGLGSDLLPRSMWRRYTLRMAG